MRRIDEQFLETLFYGSRQMRLHLRHQGIVVTRTCAAVDAQDGADGDLPEAQNECAAS